MLAKIEFQNFISRIYNDLEKVIFFQENCSSQIIREFLKNADLLTSVMMESISENLKFWKYYNTFCGYFILIPYLELTRIILPSRREGIA